MRLLLRSNREMRHISRLQMERLFVHLLRDLFKMDMIASRFRSDV